MNDRCSRLESAQREVAAAMARVNQLADLVPEPVASVSDAIRSLSPEQREAIWAQRTEAMRLVALETEQQKAALARLTAQGDELSEEFESLMTNRAFETGRSPVELSPFGHAPTSFNRMTDIAQWFSEHDEEIGQLKTLIRELEDLYAELEANPVAPPVKPGIG